MWAGEGSAELAETGLLSDGSQRLEMGRRMATLWGFV